MTITLRRYKMFADYERVNNFLRHNFIKYQLNGNVLQPAWEYSHAHPGFNFQLVHRFGIWEDNGDIVAVACYEGTIGEAFFSTKKGYEHMKPDMIEYAEKELAEEVGGQRKICVYAFDFETKLKEKLQHKGYTKAKDEPITVYRYENGFLERSLPEGFSIISLEEENDIKKVNEVLYRGFNHGDDVDEDFDCRLQMQSAPNFRKDLTIVIKAPNGDYACFAGMWLDGVNDYAYLEPMATDPRYRRLGLATIALMEAMKRTVKFGATYCFGGSREFYHSIGFETISHRERWVKTW